MAARHLAVIAGGLRHVCALTRRRGANTAHTQMGRPTHEEPTRSRVHTHKHKQTCMHPVKSYLGEGAPLWSGDRTLDALCWRTSFAAPRLGGRAKKLLTTADDARCFTRHTTDMHSANGQQPRRCGVWLSVSGRKGPATVAAVRALAWPDRALEWHEARWHTALSNCGPPKEHRLCALALVLPASRVLQPTPGPHPDPHPKPNHALTPSASPTRHHPGGPRRSEAASSTRTTPTESTRSRTTPLCQSHCCCAPPPLRTPRYC